MMSPVYCTSCGSPNVADAKFCWKCGQKTASNSGAMGRTNALSTPDNSAMMTAPVGANASRPIVRTSLLVVVSVVVVTICGVVALMFVPSGSGDRGGTELQSQEGSPLVQGEVARGAVSARRSATSYACGNGRCRVDQFCCEDGHCVAHDLSGPDVCGLNGLRDCDPKTGEPCVAPAKCKVVQWSPSMHGFQCLN
jgi:hypothetical protein